MGHPKALTRAGGRSAVESIARAGLEGGCTGVAVVYSDPTVGAHVEALKGDLGDHILLVKNLAPNRGRTRSLACGLEAIPAAAQALLLHPVDHPLVESDTITRLLESWRLRDSGGVGPLLAEPRCGGRHGHPILLDAQVFSSVRGLADDTPLRDLVRSIRDRGRAVAVEVTDVGVNANLDVPEDLIRFGLQGPG